jgi:type VI secretion system secreted protein VgrG
MLLSGHFLTLTGHPRQQWNDLWLLTEVIHTGQQPQSLEASILSAPNDELSQGYRNTFLATPWDAPYRPPLAHPKATINGYQHAVVCGPPAKKFIATNTAVFVSSFHRDRDGAKNDHSSCWVRVASKWAHDRHGSVLIPASAWRWSSVSIRATRTNR